MVVEFFLMFHKDKPVDWLMDHILWVKVCNPEKDAVSYIYDKAVGWICSSQKYPYPITEAGEMVFHSLEHSSVGLAQCVLSFI